jgi:hypothetical protein
MLIKGFRICSRPLCENSKPSSDARPSIPFPLPYLYDVEGRSKSLLVVDGIHFLYYRVCSLVALFAADHLSWLFICLLYNVWDKGEACYLNKIVISCSTCDCNSTLS